MKCIKYPGWPALYCDTPEDIEKRKKAYENAIAILPEIYRADINGKTYRIRGYINDGMVSGSVCEWLYKKKWHRCWNYEMNSQLKNDFEESLHH